ncbi:AzlD family protein [Undibacter mobilis]|uniref:AzlD domain-containing protein n=1 Tax=Undibacter mobilis TaxID=2292256 RepID=A0A371BBR6_9BRAD|nr:AzlD domain-containing protein [Undibacter mobilis]RDV04791.1 AzlD domain-containing protein [Undibacter mobilis]
MIEKDAFGFFIVIALMTIVVYLGRIGGFWLIGRLVIGPRLRRMLDALPGAIIAATVAPALVQGGLRAILALTATLVVMIAIRKDFAAVVAGVAVAAAAFAYGI